MPSPMRSHVESDKKAARLFGSLLVAAAALLLAPQVRAQTNSSAPSRNSSSAIPAMRSEDHFTWIEQLDGSSNTEGQVMLLDSSVSYQFGRHLLVDPGVPPYFIRSSTTTASGASTSNSLADL